MTSFYAPFGTAIYGETPYGVPLSANIQSTLSVLPYQYEGLQVNWTPPTNAALWTTLVLVRSSYGYPLDLPTSTNGTEVNLGDETVLLFEEEGSQYSTQYIDLGLSSGRFYYYTIFVYVPEDDEYVAVGSAQGLVLTDWNFEGIYQSWMPNWYLEEDSDFSTSAQPDGPLVRFLNLLGFEMNWMRSEIESMYLLTNPELCSGSMLVNLGSNVGIGYEPELGTQRTRFLIGNAVNIYKQRGTNAGVQAAASAYSGYPVVVTLGKNLEIQLDDSAFDESTGHWIPNNNNTSLSTVAVASLSSIPTVPHTVYQPLPSSIPLTTEGYLPVNNENVLQITVAGSGGSGSTSTFLWQQLTTLASIYTGGVNPGLSNLSTGALAFGGMIVNQYGGGNSQVTNQTWTWTFAGGWSQRTPATSPTARMGMQMAYDPTTGQAVMSGGSSGGPVSTNNNDTWTWTGTTWTELAGSGSPPIAFGGMDYGGSSGQQMLLFGGSRNIYNQYGNNDWSIVPSSDTYAWTGSAWSRLSPATVPHAREAPAMAYDFTHGNLIMFGGVWTSFDGNYNGSEPNIDGTNYDGGAAYTFGGTWEWNGTTWAMLTPTNSPSPRWGAALAYSRTLGGLVLFGGITFESVGNAGPTFLNDTWFWNGSNWIELTTTTQPPIPKTNPNEGGNNFDVGWYPNATYIPAAQGADFLCLPPWPTSASATGSSTPTYLGNAQSGSGGGGAIGALSITTAVAANAQTLGIPVLVTETDSPEITLSASFLCYSGVTTYAFAQIDWYNQAGGFVSSVAGTPVETSSAAWVRPYVSSTPPGKATPTSELFYAVRRFGSTGTGASVQLMDAEQIEVNTQATPTPTTWQPPRDIKVNLLPVRQNLVPNPVALGGTFGYTVAGGGGAFLTPISGGSTNWPVGTDSGFSLTVPTPNTASTITSALIPVNAGYPYTFSFYTEPNGGVALTLTFVVSFYTSGSSLISSVSGSVLQEAGEFVQGFIAGMEAPAGAINATYVINIPSNSAARNQYFGAIMFEPSSSLNPYFDANFSPSGDYAFESTPNESVSDYYPNFEPRVARLVEVLSDFVPIGSTFSLFSGAMALVNAGLSG